MASVDALARAAVVDNPVAKAIKAAVAHRVVDNHVARAALVAKAVAVDNHVARAALVAKAVALVAVVDEAGGIKSSAHDCGGCPGRLHLAACLPPICPIC